MNKVAQSLIDLLIQIPGLQLQILPGLKQNIGLQTRDPKAKMLMAVWEDVANKVADKKFKRPATMSQRDIQELEVAGYIKQHGDNIVMTKKGSDLIKIMLLNDNSHTFDEEKNEISEIFSKGSDKKIKRASSDNVIPTICCCNWYKRSGLYE